MDKHILLAVQCSKYQMRAEDKQELYQRIIYSSLSIFEKRKNEHMKSDEEVVCCILGLVFPFGKNKRIPFTQIEATQQMYMVHF